MTPHHTRAHRNITAPSHQQNATAAHWKHSTPPSHYTTPTHTTEHTTRPSHYIIRLYHSTNLQTYVTHHILFQRRKSISPDQQRTTDTPTPQHTIVHHSTIHDSTPHKRIPRYTTLQYQQAIPRHCTNDTLQHNTTTINQNIHPTPHHSTQHPKHQIHDTRLCQPQNATLLPQP